MQAGAEAMPQTGRRGSAAEVFVAFLRLGLTSFGGPIAHLGYFREEFVTRRQWLDDAAYADLVALAQFLPGPASSQVGFALGLMRAGAAGGVAAFVGFTLPSALAMLAAALGAGALGGPVAAGAVAGLKVVAVAIVAQAVWGMARSLCPDLPRASIAVAGAVAVSLVPGAFGQVGAIAAGLAAGLIWCRAPEAGRAPGAAPRLGVPRPVALACLAAVAALLAVPPFLSPTGTAAFLDAVFRSGALVFGGGHVVLPLLQAGVVAPGWVAPDAFLAGYGIVQAMPGPLFTFAGYLGAVSSAGPGGAAGAALALGAIFLPGMLLVLGAAPFWDRLSARGDARAALRGANAAVVGILGAALHDPVFTAGVTGRAEFALALLCLAGLALWRLPVWSVVGLGALGGIVIALS